MNKLLLKDLDKKEMDKFPELAKKIIKFLSDENAKLNAEIRILKWKRDHEDEYHPY